MLISHFRYLLRRDIALLCTSNKSALKQDPNACHIQTDSGCPFDEMVVYKDLKKSNFISSFKLPSFMRDSQDLREKSDLSVQ